MSAATPNFFAVLSDDSAPAVGSNAVHLEGAPKTVSSTSSKKADVNPRADPSRARPRAPGAPSNDRLLKESKQAGRSNNRNVPVTQGASSHHSRRAEGNDRTSRSGKRDTAKRTRSGWGDEKAEPKEQAAAADVAKDLERENAEEGEEPTAAPAPQAPKITFDEYMQSQREQADALNTRKPKVAAAPAVVPSPVDLTPEPRKKHSNKPRKEAEILPLDATAAPPLLRQNDRRERSSEGRSDRRPDRRAPRGDKPAAKRGGKPAKGGRPGKPGPKIDLSALPTLK